MTRRPSCPIDRIRSGMTLFAEALEQTTAAGGRRLVVDGPALLAERAAHRVTSTADQTRTARLVEAADGWIVINLPRPDDWELVPAWLGPAVAPTWPAVEEATAQRSASETVATGSALGLAVAEVPRRPGLVDEQLLARGQADGSTPWRWAGGPIRSPVALDELTVVELAPLWAGPLCGRLLADAGAHVVTVTDPDRGQAALTHPGFHTRLAANKQPVSISFASASAQRDLHDLLVGADVVIEGSRPRALDNIGIMPEHYVDRGTLWLSVTAYGRTGPWRNRIGFGDDVAAAAGAVRWHADGGSPPRPELVGDAPADPVAGLAGATAVTGALAAGRAGMIDLAMREAVSFIIGTGPRRVPSLPPTVGSRA